MELREYASVIWKWLWLIVLATAVAAFASWYAVKDQPAIYQTWTTLLIGEATQKANPSYNDFYTAERLAQTYAELATREPVLRGAARALGMEDQWQNLRRQITVDSIEDTLLLEIKVTGTDPLQTKQIADQVARQLIAAIDAARPRDRNQAFVEEQAATLPPKIAAAQEEIQKLEAELGTAFSARQIQDLQNQITTLQNQVNMWQATFAQYQLLLGESGLNVLTVIEEAPLPVVPVGPNWIYQVALAAAIGMVLAVAAAFLIEYLDDTLRSSEDVEKTTGLTALGVIGRIPGDKPSEKLIAASHPKAPISEAYRALRTSLRYASPDRTLKTLVVTSPNALEGKSTMAANLAVVMAQAGQSVVLVDADLRRPMLHRIFDLKNGDGLTSLLFDDALLMDGQLQPTGIENLRLLTSGPIPPNPSELLGSQRMQRFIQHIGAEADLVVFDAPPVLPVTDAAVLASLADGVLLVAEAGRTRQGAARRALETMQQVGANILGIAINRASYRGRGGYYYYYYYDSQGKKGRRRRKKRKHVPPATAEAAPQAQPQSDPRTRRPRRERARVRPRTEPPTATGDATPWP